MKRIFLPWIGAMLALTCATPASAALVTWTMTGTLLSDSDPSNLMHPEFSVGKTYTLDLTLDTATSDLNPSPLIGSYSAPQFSWVLTIGTYTQSGIDTGGVLELQNNVPNGTNVFIDRITGSMSAPAQSGGGTHGISFDWFALTLGTSSALQSAAIPTTPPDPMLFDSRGIFFSRSIPGVGGGGFNGDVDTTTLAPVPLPAAAWLLLSGLGGLGAFVRRRRTTRQIV